MFGVWTILTCIVIHEFGHAKSYHDVTGKWLDVNIKGLSVELGDEKDFLLLSREQKIGLLWSGIFWGLFGLVPAFIFVPHVGLICLALYVGGCAGDLRELKDLDAFKEFK